MVEQQDTRQYARSGTTVTLGWQFPAGMIRLCLINMGLRLVTLGLYHFWAKTEVRQRIWSAIRINDEPLTYTGRGIELFVGFLIVIFGIFLPTLLFVAIVAVSFGQLHVVTQSVIVVLYIFFGFLYGVAVYRAQRYRLARTRWRGIRGALDGSPWRYAWTFFWTAVLIPFTLGWIIPWRATKLQSMITNNTSFGDQRWRFDARSGPLYLPFAVAWGGGVAIFLAVSLVFVSLFLKKYQWAQELGIPFVPSAGDLSTVFGIVVLSGVLMVLASAWYRARSINHFAHHSHIGQARFSGQLTAAGLIWIGVTNFLITVLGVLFVGLFVFACAFVFGPGLSSTAGAAGLVGAQVLPIFIAIALVLGPTLMVPIILARSVGYVVRNLSLSGTLPIDEIAQSSGSDTRYGEGLAESFDVELV